MGEEREREGLVRERATEVGGRGVGEGAATGRAAWAAAQTCRRTPTPRLATSPLH